MADNLFEEVRNAEKGIAEIQNSEHALPVIESELIDIKRELKLVHAKLDRLQVAVTAILKSVTPPPELPAVRLQITFGKPQPQSK